MRVLLQRVSNASVTVDGSTIAQINQGILLFVGITHTDTQAEINFLAEKAAGLRVFDDENGVMNQSVTDIQGEILVVSQFTLYGDTRKGKRPSYTAAAPGEISQPLFNAFVEKIRDISRLKVETGRFGADMKVSLLNDGPCTIILEKEKS